MNEILKYLSTVGKVPIHGGITVQKDADGCYTITTDRNLKIVQFTDIHIGGGFLSRKKDLKALRALGTMIKEEKPDVVIVTGDISTPFFFSSLTNNNLIGAELFASLMNNLGVYWVPTFGNHESESYAKYSREEVASFYSNDKWDKCLYQIGDENVKGCGNSVIKIKNSDGIITQAIFTIDSNDYPESHKGYDNIHHTQTDWYKATCEKLNKENKSFIEKAFDGNKKTQNLEKFGVVKSLVFMHIPPVEYKYAWNEFKENGYKDTENVKYYYGTLGEGVCHPKENDKFFETILEMKSTQGMFVGHDHVNTFSLNYKGVRLTYGMSIDYSAYRGIDKKGTQRGCTVITVKPDGTFDCYPENYYQEKYKNPDKEKVTTQQLNKEFN